MKKILTFTAVWNIITASLPIISLIILISQNWGVEALGVFGIMFSITLSIIKIPTLISGILFFNYLSLPDQELSKKKVPILVWSIINLVTGNIVGGITGLISCDSISKIKTDNIIDTKTIEENKLKKEKEKEKQKQTKNLRILSNLGIFLIIFSGFIIATSSWNQIDDMAKVGLVFMTSIIFGIFSCIFRKKVSGSNSEIIYYLLSGAFLVLTVVSIGNYSIFGDYLSFNGDGSHIITGTIFAMIGLIAYTLVKIYKKENWIYCTYLFNNIAVYIFAAGFFGNGVSWIVNSVIVVLFVLTAFNMYRKIKVHNKVQYEVILPLFSIFNLIYIATLITAQLQTTSSVLWNIIILVGLLILMQMAVSLKEKTNFRILTTILYNIVLVINIFSMQSEDLFLATIFTIIYLIHNILILLPNENEKYFAIELYLQPIKILIMTIISFGLIEDIFSISGEGNIFLILGAVTGILALIKNKLNINKIYYVISLIACNMYTLISLVGIHYGTHWVFLLINVIILGLLMYKTFKDKESNLFTKYITVIGFVGALFILCGLVKHASATIPVHLIGIAVFIWVMDRLRKYKRIDSIVVLFALFLIGSLVNELDINYEYTMIMINFLYVIGIFNFTRLTFYDMKIEVKHIIERILLVITQLPLIFVSYNIPLVYLLVLNLAYIIIGFNSRKLYSLFHVGIISIIILCIVQFGEFWSSVPIPIYFLFLGLAIIGFATYKEISKKDKLNKEEAKSISEKENKQD